MTVATAAVVGPEPDVIARREGSVGVIRLNRPKAINAVTLPMFRDIDRALDQFEAVPAVGLHDPVDRRPVPPAAGRPTVRRLMRGRAG